MSGVVTVTATAAVAVVAAESAGAAFWVSGFVPSLSSALATRDLLLPLLLFLLFDPTRFGKAAVRAAHECGTVGQRTP